MFVGVASSRSKTVLTSSHQRSDSAFKRSLVFTDVGSGSASIEQRPALADLLTLRRSDLAVVAKLDRLAATPSTPS
jgi:DNA invertase Pin-like site-specific DNA recombinase